MLAALPINERQRVSALHSYNLLGTPPEADFDALAGLAAELCQTPMAIISLVDSDRLWFKAHLGMEVQEARRDGSFCSYAILEDELFVVEDALRDDRFRDSRVVTGALQIRYYAAAILRDRQGHALGALCVMDTQARRCDERERRTLRTLARQAEALLELRRRAVELERERADRAGIEQRFRALIEPLPAIVYQAEDRPPYETIYVSPQAAELGYPLKDWYEQPGFWVSLIHPEDKTRVLAAAEKTAASGAEFDEEYRLVAKDGTVRWYRDRGRFAPGTGGGGRVWQGVFIDVTERRAAEERLRASEARLKAQNQVLSELARSAALHSGDLGATLREVTEAAARTLGAGRVSVWLYDESRTAIRCLDLYEAAADAHSHGVVWESKDYPAYFRAVEQERVIDAHDTNTDPRTREFSDSYLRPLGITSMLAALIWVSGRLTGIVCHEHTGPQRRWTLDEQSFAASVADLVGLAIEAHERRRVEEERRRSEQHLRAIIEATPECVKVVAADGSLLDMNAAGLEMIEAASLEKVKGQSMFGLIMPEHRERFRLLHERVCRGERASLEFKLRGLKGAVRWMETHAVPLEDPSRGSLVHLAVTRDITRRKQAEAARARLAAIIESAEDAIISMDLDGVVQSWNPGAERLFGYRAEEMIGRHILALVPADRRDEEARILERLKLGERAENIESVRRRKDGALVDVSLTVSPIRDDSGQVIAVSRIARDVTAQKRAEQELREAKERAEQSERLKSQFLANMSHEIRTPLNGVIGMTNLALETDLSREQRDYLETVRVCADGLLTVINDVLDFSKIEAGRLEFERVEFDLTEAVEQAAEVVAEAAHAKGLALVCAAESGLRRAAVGDPGRLKQVLLNLLSNAVKFTHRGEVRLSARLLAEDQKLAVVEFTVSDTGIGIPAEKQALVFESFAQADGSTTRQYGGTGLGLAISKRLVEQMGGELRLASAEGVGSTFTFTALFGLGKELARYTLERPFDGVRALVVDGSPAERDALRRMLAAWGCADVTEATCEEAERVQREGEASGNPFGLALVDFDEGSGLDLTRAIRAAGPCGTRVIILGKTQDRKFEEAARAAGAEAFLAKPVKQSLLYDAIVGTIKSAVADEAAAARPTSKAGGQPMEAEPGRRWRVLVAEDNVVNQKLALRLLEKLGYAAHAVANGEEALAALAQADYDLVLMDCLMPVMDGYEATAEIRRLAGAKARVPVVALTANALEGEREKCLESGMDDYLSKPVRLEELRQTLSRWLDAAPVSRAT